MTPPANLRDTVTRSLRTRERDEDLVRALALELRVRTRLSRPYLDPSDMARSDGFRLCPHTKPMTEAPSGASDGHAIHFYWDYDPRVRGLYAAFALASGLSVRHGQATAFTERWRLATEILFPSAFRNDGPRRAGELQTNAPVWLAQAACGNESGTYVRPLVAG